MERKPNPNPNLTKKIINYWKSPDCRHILKEELDKEGIGFVSYHAALEKTYPIQIDNIPDIPSILKDKFDYFNYVDSIPIAPFLIVRNGTTGIKITKDNMQELVNAPELWIPGACLRDEVTRALFYGFTDIAMDKVLYYKKPWANKERIPNGKDKWRLTHPLFLDHIELDERTLKSWEEKEMPLYFYITGITYFQNNEETYNDVKKGTLEAIKNRVLDEQLRKTEVYKKLKDFYWECKDMGETIAELLKLKDTKLKKEMIGSKLYWKVL